MISDASPLGGPAAAHPGAATKEVATVGEPPLWMVMGVCQLVDHIEHTHHRHLWNELPRLDDLTTGVLRMHGDHHPELITIRRDLEGLGATLVPHLLDEEQVLFPRIRELATASDVPARRRRSLADAISTMLTEHDDVSARLEELRAALARYRPPGDNDCATYRALFAGLCELEADTHLHIHKENDVLFPAVIRLTEQEA